MDAVAAGRAGRVASRCGEGATGHDRTTPLAVVADALDAALDTVLAGAADALVTGPIDQAAVTRSDTAFLGHTEHLPARCGVARVVMMFVGPRLRTSLVTTHRPIGRLTAELTRAVVRETVVITARALSG